jgi:hypothetical protein
MTDSTLTAEERRTEREVLRCKIAEHQARCRALPAANTLEIPRLVAKFPTERGGVTSYPPAYLVPTRWAGALAVMPH